MNRKKREKKIREGEKKISSNAMVRTEKEPNSHDPSEGNRRSTTLLGLRYITQSPLRL